MIKHKDSKNKDSIKIMILAFLSGFISLELEILATRFLTPIFGSTIYVWTSLIGMTLLFLSIGYFIGGKLADKKIITLDFLGVNVLVIGIYIGLLPFIARSILRNFYTLGLISGPLLSSLLLFMIPMTLLGFIVPTAIKLFTHSLSEVGTKAGEIYAVASLGSIAGAFITGFYFILHLGLIKTTFITSIILILFSFFFISSKIKFLFLLMPIVLIILPDSRSEQILDDYPSFYSQVRVIDFGSGPSLFRSFYEIASLTPSDQVYDDQYSIAFAYNPDIKDVLLIGFGSGNTAKKIISTYKNISLAIVEIEPPMIYIYNKYSNAPEFLSNEISDGADNRIHNNLNNLKNSDTPSLRSGNYIDNDNLLQSLAIDDGRHYLNTKGKYDLIIIDNAISYDSYHLATREFFEEAYQHLAEKGSLLALIHTSLEGPLAEPGLNLFKTLKAVFADAMPFHQDIESRPDAIYPIPFFAVKEQLLQDSILEHADSIITKNNEPVEKILSFNFRLKANYEADPYSKISTDSAPFIETIALQSLDQTRMRVLDGNIEVFLP